LTRLGPKAIVALLLPNGPREHDNASINFMLREYYEAQDEMNHWARILQSPESIEKVWEEEQLSRKKKARAVPSVYEESLRPDD
jgi:hypothetical protein